MQGSPADCTFYLLQLHISIVIQTVFIDFANLIGIYIIGTISHIFIEEANHSISRYEVNQIKMIFLILSAYTVFADLVKRILTADIESIKTVVTVDSSSYKMRIFSVLLELFCFWHKIPSR